MKFACYCSMSFVLCLGSNLFAEDGAAKQENSKKPMSREDLAKAVGVDKFNDPNEKPVNCPRCGGSGVAIWLECLKCKRSVKPGYLNLGDHMEICKACSGSAKIVGVFCNLCNRTGKIRPSQVPPADGGNKKAPVGWAWCTACNGTGVDTWLPCNQCKRSKWPGYTYFGDSLTVCNRCNGLAKLIGTLCSKCGGKKIVHEP